VGKREPKENLLDSVINILIKFDRRIWMQSLREALASDTIPEWFWAIRGSSLCLCYPTRSHGHVYTARDIHHGECRRDSWLSTQRRSAQEAAACLTKTHNITEITFCKSPHSPLTTLTTSATLAASSPSMTTSLTHKHTWWAPQTYTIFRKSRKRHGLAPHLLPRSTAPDIVKCHWIWEEGAWGRGRRCL